MRRFAIAAALFCVGLASGTAVAQDPQETHKHDAPAAKSGGKAASAFERFKALRGAWRGSGAASNGTPRTERATYQTIAAGSCVMETTLMDDPEQNMVTMYHLDGERLMLTHYCMARNQPRMVATEISDDGRTIHFTFLDGTNLPSRDRGHMDSVRVQFIDDDHFMSRWSFYKDGKEQWMEEFRYERARTPE